METILSRDGTPIACYRSGSGPALILVHGIGAANAAAWTGVIPALENRFTVIVIDRRGRGASGDGVTYAIEREYEDIVAVAEAFNEPVNLLGHSFGGLLALEAALLTRNIRKLILYGSVPTPDQPGLSEKIIGRLGALSEAGDREGVLATFYREVAGMNPQEIELLRSSPAWQARMAAVGTLPREVRALGQYAFDPVRFRDLQTPTLLLLGGESPPSVKNAVETVAAALPHSRIAVLPGQKQVAMYTAPALFLQPVLAFLNYPD